jgi:hypothetical protein
MKVSFIPEPELEFGHANRHIDIRFGLSRYGPRDVDDPLAPKKIALGIVGTPEGVEKVTSWLDRCRTEIPAKRSRQPNLFPYFPGFREDGPFRSTLLLDPQLCQTIPERVFTDLLGGADHNTAVSAAVEMFLGEFATLSENRRPNVLLCAVPHQLVGFMDPASRLPAKSVKPLPPFDFHDMLKARSMRFDLPVQLLLPQTYDASSLKRQKVRSTRLRLVQDEATRAWNLHTALYYKAMGRPWRLVRDHAALDACFVGISFFYNLDRSSVMTSMAQVFDERGDGIIVRGGPAAFSKDDRTPHLTKDSMQGLLGEALGKYQDVHLHLPARLVLHKTSPFNASELDGVDAATVAHGVSRTDALSVISDVPVRLFRTGAYPPLRGTTVRFDDQLNLVYLRGSIDFYQTYPGGYIPRPFGFRCDRTDESPAFLAREILALSKMNWNDTQFDGGNPITVTAARKVAGIMKYVPSGSPVAWRYAHYM